MLISYFLYPKTGKGPAQISIYPLYAAAASRTAVILGLLPHEVQAIAWMQWRKRKGYCAY